MRKPNLVAFVAASLLVVPSVGFGQSLAEAAAKEKARRKALAESNKKPAKSYSDTDLGNAQGSNASFPSGPDSSTAAVADKDDTAPGATKEKTDDEKRAEATAAWRKSLDEANASAASYRDQATKIQSDLDDTSSSLYSNRRTTMLNQLEEAKKKQVEAEAKAAELEEQGRRNGYR